MIDTHSHLMHSVDDGSKSIEESILILEELSKLEIKQIILTPHYVKESIYASGNNEKNQKINVLKTELLKRKIDINLYLGNEVMIDEDIIKDIQDNKIATLNNSRYILVEFPHFENYANSKNILKELIKHGYTPILAHPERYTYHYKDFEFYTLLINEGVLFQCNLRSILGHYGKRAKEMIEELLKRNMIHILATDIHRMEELEGIKQSINKLKQQINTEKIEELMRINAKKILNNEDVVKTELKTIEMKNTENTKTFSEFIKNMFRGRSTNE
jgi:Capsular polysaccharide biosynthesis protein